MRCRLEPLQAKHIEGTSSASVRSPNLVRARREGLDGGHAPAGITLMAGEARTYLMRGRPVRLQSTSQTSIRNSSGRRLPAAEIRPGSLVARSSALLRAAKAVIAALASESRI